MSKLEIATVKLSEHSRECLLYARNVEGAASLSIKNYELTHLQFLSYLQQKGHPDVVRSFTQEAVMGFCEEGARRAKWAGSTINNKLAGLHVLAVYLMTRRDDKGKPHLAADPTRGFKRPRIVRTKTKFLYPADGGEFDKYMSLEVHPRIDLARAFLVQTGLRRLEVCEANCGDLRQDHAGSWILSIPVKGRRRENEEPAEVPILGELALRLAASIEEREAGAKDPLLVDRKGKRWTPTQMSSQMVRLGQAAGITRLRTSPHKLRHTANVVARLAGVDAKTRQAMLNHRNPRTLDRYDHLVPGEAAAGQAKAAQYLTTYRKGAGAEIAAAPPSLLEQIAQLSPEQKAALRALLGDGPR